MAITVITTSSSNSVKADVGIPSLLSDGRKYAFRIFAQPIMSTSRTELLDELIRIDVARKKVFPYLIGVDAPHAKVGVKGMFR